MGALRVVALLAVGVTVAAAALAFPSVPTPRALPTAADPAALGDAADEIVGASPDRVSPRVGGAPASRAGGAGPRLVEALPDGAADPGAPARLVRAGRAGDGLRVSTPGSGATEPAAASAESLTAAALARAGGRASPWAWAPGEDGAVDTVAARSGRSGAGPALSRGGTVAAGDAPSIRVTVTFEYFRGETSASSSASTSGDGHDVDLPSDPGLDLGPESDTGIDVLVEPTTRSRAPTGGGGRGTSAHQQATHPEAHAGGRAGHRGTPPPRQDREAGTRAAQAQSL